MVRSRSIRQTMRFTVSAVVIVLLGFSSKAPWMAQGFGTTNFALSRHGSLASSPSNIFSPPRNRAVSATCQTTTTKKTSLGASLVAAELLSDVLTSGTINTISDCVAQFLESVATNATTIITNTENSEIKTAVSEEQNYDWIRTQRLAVFGLADGVVSHLWFLELDELLGEGQGLFDTAMKTAADTLVYTPIWCAWFLAAMALLEGNERSIEASNVSNTLESSSNNNNISTRIQSIPRIWRSDWLTLLRGNLGFFLPITGTIYGIVPREERVLAFGVAGLVYTTILSLWNQSREGNDSNNNTIEPL